MKKKNLLLILSIVEIVSLVLFIVTFKVAFDKTIEIVVLGFTKSWINYKEVPLSNIEKLCIIINNITPYIILISAITRFIFTDIRCKIALCITLLTAFISLVFLYWGNSIMSIFGFIFLIITIAIYIYSHKINFNDNSKIKDLFKKN